MPWICRMRHRAHSLDMPETRATYANGLTPTCQDAARDQPASRWRSSRRDNLHPRPWAYAQWEVALACILQPTPH